MSLSAAFNDDEENVYQQNAVLASQTFSEVLEALWNMNDRHTSVDEAMLLPAAYKQNVLV
jgi:hypothetical protein